MKNEAAQQNEVLVRVAESRPLPAVNRLPFVVREFAAENNIFVFVYHVEPHTERQKKNKLPSSAAHGRLRIYFVSVFNCVIFSLHRAHCACAQNESKKKFQMWQNIRRNRAMQTHSFVLSSSSPPPSLLFAVIMCVLSWVKTLLSAFMPFWLHFCAAHTPTDVRSTDATVRKTV